MPAANSAPVKQWSIHELTFEAGGSPEWNSFPLNVAFRNDETRIEVDGYWDGGKTWRVRFAPTAPGQWRWTSSSLDGGLGGREGSFQCEEPSREDIDRNPNCRGHLKISDSGRYFTYADGTPFLYVGDTCWSVNERRCGLGDHEDGPFYVWMKDRKAKGFTVVNHWFFRSGRHSGGKEVPPTSNEGGHPFRVEMGDYVFEQIRPEFYRYVDVRWRALWENGFVMAGPPTWFAKPARCMTLEEAQNVSRYLVARYGAFNLVWALSGEYSYGAEKGNSPWDQVSTWKSLGAHVASHNSFGHPISIHPGPAVFHASSSVEFHDDEWLDHNWLQTGQYPEGLHRVAVWAKSDYERTPLRPLLQSEGFYEGKPGGKKGATPYHARWQPWVAFLNGACGAVYGAHGIWAFTDASDPDTMSSLDDSDWREALALPGSEDVGLVARFFGSIEWWKLVPQRDRLLVDGKPAAVPTETDVTPPHCAAEPERICVVYVPEGNEGRKIELTRVPAEAGLARWYDPREGTYLDIDNRPCPDGRYELPQRPSPSGGDWVFVLGSAATLRSSSLRSTSG